ncbi:hypothetical protein GCK32_021670 [Trichostrongylus colubriformis]|uniref:ShKT domain-containing protein n=1 Tax=Trichostrongylus colubriformis TaxID=6319 RepID=A0AAN8GC03_TRICO
MLFYVLIAFIALNAFTQEGVMAVQTQGCTDMIPSLCQMSYKRYCDDKDDLGTEVRKMCRQTCGCNRV